MTTPDYRYERLGGAWTKIDLQRRLNRNVLYLSASDSDPLSMIEADDFFGTATAAAPVATVTYAPTGGVMLKPLKPREKKRERVFKDEEQPRTAVLVGTTQDELPETAEGRAELRMVATLESFVASSPHWGGYATLRLTGSIRSADRPAAVGRMQAVVSGRSADDDEAMALIIVALED